MEQLPSEEQAPALEDITEKVTAQLQQLDKKIFAAVPRGLLCSLPGQEATSHIFIDKGCRGGWDETYTQQLGQEVYSVQSVRTDRFGHANLILTDPDNPRGSGGTVTINLRSLPEGTKFYTVQETDPITPSLLTDHMNNELGKSPVYWLNDATTIIPPGKQLLAYCKEPLSTPIWRSLGHESEGRFEALANTPVASLVAVRTTEGDLVTITPSLSIDTPFYARLEDVVLHQAEANDYAKEQDLSQRLKRSAEWLLKLCQEAPEEESLIETAVSELNQLLQSVEEESTAVYLPISSEQRRLGSRYQLVTAKAGELSMPQVVTIVQERLSLPYLAADEVVYDGVMPWAVDNSQSLATPMLKPAFKVTSNRETDSPGGFYAHIANLVRRED